MRTSRSATSTLVKRADMVAPVVAAVDPDALACCRGEYEDYQGRHCPSHLLFGPWRDSQAQEHENGLVEPQDILTVRPADARTNLGLWDSGIKRQAVRRPLRSFGCTGRRNNGASVSSVVKAQMMIELVASKLLS